MSLIIEIQPSINSYIIEDEDDVITDSHGRIVSWGHKNAFFIKFIYRTINDKHIVNCIVFRHHDGAYLHVESKTIENQPMLHDLLKETWSMRREKDSSRRTVPYPTKNNIKKRSAGSTICTFPKVFIAEGYVTKMSVALKSTGPIKNPDSKVAITAKLTFFHRGKEAYVACEMDMEKNKIYLEGTKKEYIFKNAEHVLRVARKQFNKYTHGELEGANEIDQV